MRTLALVMVAWSFALIVTTNVDAQAPSLGTPVPHCMHECAPRDKDVNGPVVATSRPVKVILYGHFESLLNIAPLNTQQPDPLHEKDLNGKFLMPIVNTQTGICTPGPPPICPDFHFKNNEFVMESSPGLVEYLPGGGWRTHQEPGLGAPVKIAAKSFNLYWYLSAYAVPNGDSTSTPAVRVGVMPQVAIYARMETGRFRYQGELIAESANVSDMGLGGAGRTNMVTLPTGDEVYEFQVPMFVKNDGVIPSSSDKAGFIVYVNPYQVSDGYRGGIQAGQADWRLRTGPKFPPRIVLPVQDPLLAAGLRVYPGDGKVYVTAAYLAPFGSYDLNASATRVDVSGPRPVSPDAIKFLKKQGVCGICHEAFRPVNWSWRIDVPPAQLEGDRVQVTFQNRQDTFQVVQGTVFHVNEYRGLAASPGPGLMLALAGVVLAALLWRRAS